MVEALYTEHLPPALYTEVMERVAQPWAPVRELHGTSPAERRAAKAMYDLAGGPAPPRAPKT